jgi:hypothetical protein
MAWKILGIFYYSMVKLLNVLEDVLIYKFLSYRAHSKHLWILGKWLILQPF